MEEGIGRLQCHHYYHSNLVSQGVPGEENQSALADTNFFEISS